MVDQFFQGDYMEMSLKKNTLVIIYFEKKHSFHVDKTIWGEPMEEDIEEQLGEPEMEIEPRTTAEERSGISSVVSGMETPDIELQKRPMVSAQQVQNINYNPKDTVPKPLYQVLEPVQVKFL